MDGRNESIDGLDFLLLLQGIHVQLDELVCTRLAVMLLITLVFVAFNSIMFFILRSKTAFREKSRYILFAQMLLNDSIQLIVSAVLVISVALYSTPIKAVCAIILLVSATTFYNAPLNVAMMSLERYIAICFPLHHAEIATPRRTSAAIAVVWLLGSLNFVINVIGCLILDSTFFTSPVMCTLELLLVARWQHDLFQAFNIFYFVGVGILITYTYVGIMMAARSAKAQKAKRTVMLHMVQLGLCLTSFLFTTVERALTNTGSINFHHLRFINFLLLLLLPRCLSPFIYGLRDEGVRPLFIYYLRCRTWKVKPVTAH